MSTTEPQQGSGIIPGASAPKVVLSVDAMGGDLGPEAVVAGLARAARKNPDIAFILHGPRERLEPLLARRRLGGRCVVRDARGVVEMSAKPSQVMRHGEDTSMWSALESVRSGEAQVCISCGNTGALMALSMMRLRKLPGVARPAIAVLWPSRNETGVTVMLDAGADVRADPQDLLRFALMGASYARNGLGVRHPRVGLINVGTEEHKGRSELHEAHDLISAVAPEANFSFAGYVEGGDLTSDSLDVIVTDGFTGNVALKAAEGTARFIRETLRAAFAHSPLSRLASLLAYTSLRRLSKRIDPRRVNGGVFLGLNGTVVKSHGSADATAVAAAVKLAWQLGESGFTEKLAARVASAVALQQDASLPEEEGGQDT